MVVENTARTYKDLLPSYVGFEPMDFTRVHDRDLMRIRSVLLEVYGHYSHYNFTDRHQTAPRIKEVLDLLKRDK
jgi:hypothetical protein